MKYLILVFTFLFSLNSFADYKVSFDKNKIEIPESPLPEPLGSMGDCYYERNDSSNYSSWTKSKTTSSGLENIFVFFKNKKVFEYQSYDNPYFNSESLDFDYEGRRYNISRTGGYKDTYSWNNHIAGSGVGYHYEFCINHIEIIK